MSTVLVVDDDPGLRRALELTLRAHGHAVRTAATGAEALRAVGGDVDLVVLDLGLPDLDGAEVLAALRAWSGVPVVVLSARASGADKVALLDAGADDYVVKPFAMDELMARVRAAMRRRAPGGPDAVVETAAFTVDLAAAEVRRDGAAVRLTPTEWHVLAVLARAPGQLVTQRELLHEVWGPAYEKETHYLRVYLAGLRRKLEPDPAHPRHLVTEPGRGYRLVP